MGICVKIFVTGGSGFIGTNLMESLIGSHEVVNYDVKAPLDAKQASYWQSGTILDGSRLKASLTTFAPDVVIHLAARTDLLGNFASDYIENVLGVQNLVEAVRCCARSPRTIYVSSRLVFAVGHSPVDDFDYLPSTAYGLSKVAGENIVRDLASAGGDWCIARPTSVWGPWFASPYKEFFLSIRNRVYFNVKGRNPSKSFGYVGNVVYQLCALVEAPRDAIHGRVFWLSDYEPVVVSEWAKLIALKLGVLPPRTLPYFMLKAAALLGDALRVIGYSEPPLTTFRLNNMLADMVYDTESLELVVGNLPFTVEAGVELTTAWMRGHLPERV